MNYFFIRVVSAMAAASAVTAPIARANETPNVVDTAEEVVVGALIEDRKTGERLGITCAKMETVTVGVNEVETCVELQFVLTNPKVDTLYAKPIGKKLSREAVREFSETRYLGDRDDPTANSASYVNYNILNPVYYPGMHPLALSAVVAVGSWNGTYRNGLWGFLMAALPATFVLDIAKDAVVYPVVGVGVALMDAGIGIRNAVSHLSIAIQNGMVKGAVKKYNRKTGKAISKALANSENGSSVGISHALFTNLVAAIQSCQGEDTESVSSCDQFTVDQ